LDTPVLLNVDNRLANINLRYDFRNRNVCMQIQYNNPSNICRLNLHNMDKYKCDMHNTLPEVRKIIMKLYVREIII